MRVTGARQVIWTIWRGMWGSSAWDEVARRSEIEILPSIIRLRNWIHLNTKLDQSIRSGENQKQEVHIE